MTPFVGRLGKKAPRDDPRTLKLRAYLPAALPAAPAQLDLGAGIDSWPMYANDSHGDCTCAAAGHMIEIWSRQLAGIPATFTDQQVLDLYGLVNGGSDDGAVELDVLNAWRSTGLGGDKILAFAAVDRHNLDQVRSTCWMFSGLYLGLSMPQAWQDATVWDAPTPDQLTTPAWAVGSWGGHAVDVVAYDQDGVDVVTWGRRQRLTWNGWRFACVEAWCVLPSEYQLLKTPLANGFDFAGLMSDIEELEKQ